MPDITPRHELPIPVEFEEPYFDAERGFQLGVDAATFANAENSQLQFTSDGLVGWSASGGSTIGAGLLYWSKDILATSFSTPFKAKIGGPASVELSDGEVIFFIMPRLMAADTTVQLYRANRIFLSGTRLHDLRLFCARIGTTVYFYNGKSLKDTDNGLLFGGGLVSLSVYPAHEHLDPLVIKPPAAGIATLDAQITSPDLARLYLFRDGQLQIEPDQYSLNAGTGIITLVTPTTTDHEVFEILREQVDTSVATSTHSHLTPLKFTPAPATSTLDILLTDPAYNGADLFRGGLLQAQPDDYTLDTATGIVTLTTATVGGEVFVALRRMNI